MTYTGIKSVIITTEIVPNVIWPFVGSMIIDYFGFMLGVYIGIPLKLLGLFLCMIGIFQVELIMLLGGRTLIMSGTFLLELLLLSELLKQFHGKKKLFSAIIAAFISVILAELMTGFLYQ